MQRQKKSKDLSDSPGRSVGKRGPNKYEPIAPGRPRVIVVALGSTDQRAETSWVWSVQLLTGPI